MRIIRKICLSLVILLLIMAFLLAGIFAPAKLFELVDRTEEGNIRYQELGAVDLTLTPSDNLFERMAMLVSRDRSVLKDLSDGTTSTEADVMHAALRFLDTMCFYANIDLPEQIQTDYLQALLCMDEKTKQTAIYWEYNVYLPKEGLSMLFVVDDITAEVVGLHCIWMEPHAYNTEWTATSLLYALQQTFDLTLSADAPCWTDVDTPYEPYDSDEYPIYLESRLTIQKKETYYHFPLSVDSTQIVFNLPYCLDMRSMYGVKTEWIYGEDDGT